MYKHYIRLNEQNEIIRAFSDSVREPLETDILIKESNELHFRMDLIEIIDEIVKYKYEYIKGEIVEKTVIELTAEEQLQVDIARKKKIQLDSLIDLINTKNSFEEVKTELNKII